LLGAEIYVAYSSLERVNKMEKLTFWKLLREARFLKYLGLTQAERYISLGGLIRGAKYYYLEQG